ncbi:MAG: aspartate aminotransferase family protein, partial [Chloroflexota bacterium]
PRVVEAISKQAAKLTHNCFTLFSNEPTVALAERLVELAPGDFPKKVWFGLSGSDANDAIYKLTRRATGRERIVTFIGSYHGQTMGAYSLSGHKAESAFVGLPGVVKVPYAYCYRCPFGMTHPSCRMQCLRFIEETIFNTICPPEDVAGILVEAIQGDSGIVVPPDEFLTGLKAMAERYGMLFMVDEVRTGLGRTGKMFAIEHTGAIPDLITIAKPLGSGVPISACVARSDILDTLEGSHLLTTGGSPIGSAAALTTLDVIRDEGLMARAEETGEYLRRGLCELQKEHEIIGDVRGRGLFTGVEMVRDRVTKEPADTETHKICYRAWRLGLVLIFCGTYSNVLDIVPPLVLSHEQVDRGLEILDQAIRDVSKGLVSDEEISQYRAW